MSNKLKAKYNGIDYLKHEIYLISMLIAINTLIVLVVNTPYALNIIKYFMMGIGIIFNGLVLFANTNAISKLEEKYKKLDLIKEIKGMKKCYRTKAKN